jgi:hypothetical protein
MGLLAQAPSTPTRFTSNSTAATPEEIVLRAAPVRARDDHPMSLRSWSPWTVNITKNTSIRVSVIHPVSPQRYQGRK